MYITDVVVDAYDIALRSPDVRKGSGIAVLWVAALCPCAADGEERIVAAPSQRELQSAQCTSKGDVDGCSALPIGGSV